jgi:hypothetical protein
MRLKKTVILHFASIIDRICEAKYQNVNYTHDKLYLE